jgi:hypothetical protein
MAVRWAIANGDWNNTATWNSGGTLGIPTSADDVWANNFTVNMNTNATVISLNNTSRSGIATPQMTSNTAPSPFVANASNTDGANVPWRAFDRVIAPNNAGWATLIPTTTGSLSIDFGVGNSAVIDGYIIHGFTNQAVNPRNWTFDGSNDGVNWTTLHTVALPAAIAASGNYTNAAIGNTTAYRFYRVNITLNGGGTQVGIVELELYPPNVANIASGGSFNFNTAGVTVTCTSTSASLSAGATNLIQVTATTGTVTLNVSSNVTGLSIGTTQIFNHTGACNFNLSGLTFTGGSVGSSFCINKSSTGTISITGSLVGGTNATAPAINSTAGNTVVLGNVTANQTPGISQTAGNVTVTGNVAGSTLGFANAFGLSLSGANTIVSVTGNVIGGSSTATHGINLTGAASQFIVIGNVTGGTASSVFGISHSGTSGSVTGDVRGGTNTSAHGISTAGNVTITGNVTGGTTTTAYGVNTTNTLTVNGNVQGGSFLSAHGINTTASLTVTGSVIGSVGAGVQTTTSSTVTGSIFAGAVGAGIVNSGNASLTVAVRGDVYSSATQNGIVLTGTGTQVVNLAGNMYNTLGRNAIWCPNIFISNAATSLWRIDTGGGNYKTLYSADSTPNLPPTSSVRNGITYGPALALTGSMVVPSASNVRAGVAVDNTVGTGELTSADIINGINASSNDLAVRLKNTLTDRSAGNLMSQFNNI